ncbi:hypothetical protein G6O67_001915 [Ophiocordyceps sinensis]|uniref:Uncharacterized protein n=1 Tax=Ophiocordyceps sinensis TaxID=72228 RepID=A0A8H4PT76_9HYPO|nr:hypothetical protein G6O67_001915 [Ophiocordyceps sinensis]
MVELSCVWKDARSSRCIQCNSRGDLCESVPAMISGDMADLCGIRTKIAELWNTRDEAEKKTINLIFYQVSRHPPRLTLPGFRRAIQIYGSEPNLLRSLKSSAASFTAWNAANPALYRDFVDAVDLADQLVQHWADMKPRLGARPGWLERKRVKHGIGFGTQQLDTGIFELRIGDLSSSERPLVLEPSQHDFPASPGIFRGS